MSAISLNPASRLGSSAALNLKKKKKTEKKKEERSIPSTHSNFRPTHPSLINT